VIIESVVAFVLILCVTLAIYALGRRAAPKPVQTGSGRSVYACGEKVTYSKPRINVSLYKYLIYFVILDSSVLLLAFGSFLGQGINVPMILIYIFIILASSLLLFDGGKD
jgi:NADH:ubiquinone oxidoreductase subunit 3 (subunit A)